MGEAAHSISAGAESETKHAYEPGLAGLSLRALAALTGLVRLVILKGRDWLQGMAPIRHRGL